MQRIAIIGANGQLGCDLVAALGARAIPLARPGCDVTDLVALESQLADARPDVIINTAAQTAVDACDEDTVDAWRVNALGAWNVAQVAAKLDVPVVLISTDYVFGGDTTRTMPYVETDPPAPVNVYGATKLAGEQLTMAATPRHIILRTSAVFGHAGARGKGGNFVEAILRRASSGESLRVVTDQVVSPTYTVALARAIAAMRDFTVHGLYHLASPEPCSWHAFACEVVRLAGLDVPVAAIPSSEFPRPARRPGWSALVSERLDRLGIAPLPSWREMLREYMAGRAEAA